MSDRPRMLYLLAPSYSGSTLLTYLLAQHPSIATVGELKATSRGDLDVYRCSCGELMRECGFWQELTQLATDKGLQFSVDEFGTVYGAGRTLPERVVGALVRGRAFETLRRLLLAVLPESLPHRDAVTHQNFELSQIVVLSQKVMVLSDFNLTAPVFSPLAK